MSSETADLSDDGRGEGVESQSDRVGVVVAEGSREALVATFGDRLDDRYLGQEGDIQLVGETAASSIAEDIIAMVGEFGRGKISHIFDKAKDRDVKVRVAEELDTADDIGEGDLLWGADDDST